MRENEKNSEQPPNHPSHPSHKKVVDGIKKPDYSDRAMKTIYGERITRIIEQCDNIATCVIDGQVQLIHITKIIKP